MRAAWVFALAAVVGLPGGGCGGEHREARVTFNKGVAALQAGDLEGAAKALVEARGEAGVDPELRYRAAYDLGVAYAALADKSRRGDGKDLSKALEQAQQALSWFGDAARQQPGDAAATANQVVLRARVQAISDELRKAEGKLEARLDTAIRDQRALMEGVRDAWLAIAASGGADPLAQQSALVALADRERGIVAEVGAISDIAADEIDAIGKKPEDKREEEEKIRVVQLKNLDIFLLDARARIAEARRKLQDLAGEEALGRAEAALGALKRAREQLLDPVTVMRGVAGDEVELAKDTAQAEAGAPESGLAPTVGLAAPAAPAVVPAWLAAPALAERQNALHDRLEEVRARFDAAAAPPAPEAPKDPKREQLLARMRAALPAVAEASGAMDHARQSLAAAANPSAIDQERASLVALARAIEEFSDLKQTVELAYAEQQQLDALLGPEAAKTLKPDERASAARDALARNVARMGRLEGLIADEVAGLASAPPAPAGAQPAQLDAAKQQLAAMKEKLTKAEALRGESLAALTALGTAIAASGTDAAHDPQQASGIATAKVLELRMLFFSLIEHLEQLIRDQGDTRDRTTAIQAADDTERGAKLPDVIAREEQHGGMAQAITDELAKEADAAGKQQPQPGQPDSKALAGAAAELRQAQTAIGDARTGLVKVRDATQTSESFKPALAGEASALDHLEAALKLLQPPPQKQNDGQKPPPKDDQHPPKPDPGKPDPKQQDPHDGAPKPAGGAGQSARDQDAARQKQRQDAANGSAQNTAEPVDQDW